MADGLKEIRAEMREIHKAIEAIRLQIQDLIRLVEVIPGSGNCLTLAPGECHTFSTAPSGRLTVTNDSDEAGSVRMSWGSDVFEGEVQQTSSRTIQPMAWPAEICNTGDVPLTACAV